MHSFTKPVPCRVFVRQFPPPFRSKHGNTNSTMSDPVMESLEIKKHQELPPKILKTLDHFWNISGSGELFILNSNRGNPLGKNWRPFLGQFGRRGRQQTGKQHLQHPEGDGWQPVPPGSEQGESTVDLQPCPLQVFPPVLCLINMHCTFSVGPSSWSTHKRWTLKVS